MQLNGMGRPRYYAQYTDCSSTMYMNYKAFKWRALAWFCEKNLNYVGLTPNSYAHKFAANISITSYPVSVLARAPPSRRRQHAQNGSSGVNFLFVH